MSCAASAVTTMVVTPRDLMSTALMRRLAPTTCMAKGFSPVDGRASCHLTVLQALLPNTQYILTATSKSPHAQSKNSRPVNVPCLNWCPRTAQSNRDDHTDWCKYASVSTANEAVRLSVYHLSSFTLFDVDMILTGRPDAPVLKSSSFFN